MNGTVGLIFNKDENKEKFVCPECEKEFLSKAALTKHMKKEHAEDTQDETEE